MQQIKLIKDLDKVPNVLKEQIKGIWQKGDKVAVKLHMGEKHNSYYLKPKIIKKIIDVLLDEGVKPFLFDSVVLYAGARDSKQKYEKVAEEHGFSEEEIGCPVVIGKEGIVVEAKDINVHVCKELEEADGMLVVSHVKGHCSCGFGGAIKNLGMGGVTPQSKSVIHQAEEAEFDDLLAQGAGAVLKAAGDKVFYVNFLINISKECDCANNAGPLVADDIGVLMGKDIVAIDKASVDMIYEQKPGIFDKIHNKDPYLQIDYAERLGIGEKKYDIS
ncbi:DUF362 domain-containing protein [Candidatus Woesearchaeota archaeon]|nr:DUF362 domain-containing protein [Candidatus Woesearchaeota archaeon]